MKRYLGGAVAVLVLLEAVFFGYYTWKVRSGDVPSELDFEYYGLLIEPYKKAEPTIYRRFLLTRLLGGSSTVPGRPHVSTQKYLGEAIDESFWSEILPFDSLLGHRLGKNVALHHRRGFLYVTTKQGFMSVGDPDVHYSRRKPAGVFRVVALGGSTVWGGGSYFPEENLPAQIKKAIEKKRPGLSVEMINAGVAGYDTNQELLYLMSELEAYEPDLVISYDGWNDLVKNNIYIGRYGDDWNHLKNFTHYDADQRINKSYRLGGALGILAGAVSGSARLAFVSAAAFLETRSALGCFVGRCLTKARAALAGLIPGHAGADDREPVYDPRSVAYYREHLETMIQTAERRKFRMASFLQPLMGVDAKRLSGEENAFFAKMTDLPLREKFYADARAMFRSLKEKSEKRGRACVGDLSRVFAEVADTVYADTGHLYLKGNQIVAEAAVVELERCGCLPRGKE